MTATLSPAIRDNLGKLIREKFVELMIERQKAGKTVNPTNLVPWDEIPEWEKELYRQLGESVFEKAHKEVEQLQVQLNGCLSAAEGGTFDPVVAKPGAYGWSPAYQRVVDLRKNYDALVHKGSSPSD